MSEKYCLTLDELSELCQEITTYAPHEDKFFEYGFYINLWLEEKKKKKEKMNA